MGLIVNEGVLQFNGFFTVTIGILVLFVGRRINSLFAPLREFSIPEPVTGGILFSGIIALVYLTSSIEIEFDLTARDLLLVYFFTSIGINASLADLVKGGKPLIILLVITIAYMILQNLTGISVASLFGLDAPVGLLGGSVSLIGGHGTAIAWAPRIAEDYGVANAMEIGIASATFGLILASLMGGPIAKFLVTRHNLKANENEQLDVGVSDSEQDNQINGFDFLDAIFSIHLCIIFGFLLNELISQFGLQLPLF